MRTELLDHQRASAKGHTKAVYGRRAIFTTWDGDRLEGTVEPPLPGPAGNGIYPIIRFDDGRWARCDSVIEVVVN